MTGKITGFFKMFRDLILISIIWRKHEIGEGFHAGHMSGSVTGIS
jgi:hypothetical protein